MDQGRPGAIRCIYKVFLNREGTHVFLIEDTTQVMTQVGTKDNLGARCRLQVASVVALSAAELAAYHSQ